jgi:hypothetical protein
MGIRGAAHAGLLVALVVAVPLLGVVNACKGHAPPAVDAQERLNLISNPSLYLDADQFTFDNEASDYEQLLAMTVWNKSSLPVHGLEGDVFWLDDEGHRLGSSRFALTGSVPPLGSRNCAIADGSMTSGTLRGGALQVTIAFTHVDVGD